MKQRFILTSLVLALPIGLFGRSSLFMIKEMGPSHPLLAQADAMQTQPSNYQFATAWGTEGKEPGQFQQPIGIVVRGNKVFVSDSGNHRIQVFDRDGQFLRSFGQEGEELGDLNQPMSLGLHKKTLYVAEYLNDRVQKFSLSGKSRGAFGTSGSEPGQFDAPSDVAVDAQGHAYVVDFYNHRVQVFNPSEQVIQQYGKTRQSGSQEGLFNYPTGSDILPNGDLVVADAYNNRIQIFQPDGTFVSQWNGAEPSESDSLDGRFNTASAVATDQKGNIFVADFYNHRIQIFTSKGQFLTAFGMQGSGPGELERPIDMAIDEDGAVYVVDFGNSRIQKFVPQP